MIHNFYTHNAKQELRTNTKVLFANEKQQTISE